MFPPGWCSWSRSRFHSDSISAEPRVRPGSDFLQRGVSDNHECGFVRLEPGVVEVLHVWPGQLFNRLLRAGTRERIGIGVAVSVEDFWKDPQRRADRFGSLSFYPCDELLLQPFEICLRE